MNEISETQLNEQNNSRANDSAEETDVGLRISKLKQNSITKRIYRLKTKAKFRNNIEKPILLNQETIVTIKHSDAETNDNNEDNPDYEKDQNEETGKFQGILASNIDDVFELSRENKTSLKKLKSKIKSRSNFHRGSISEDGIITRMPNSDVNGKRKKFTMIDYRILCMNKKLNIIDIIENPRIEKKLVRVVKKAGLKVHWGEDKTQEYETDSLLPKAIRENKVVRKRVNRTIVKNSDQESEFSAAIDLLKSYYQLKETFIYYVVEDEKLLKGNLTVHNKIINIKLSNDKLINIHIAHIKKLENKLDASKFPKLSTISNLNVVVIIYQVESTVFSVSLIFKHKLKLCLFLSLLKSYHAINLKYFSEDAVELISRYSTGVNVKKVSKKGNISDCKIFISEDNVIRFISTTKMKGKVFDIMEDFISYETSKNSSYFNVLDENQKKEIHEDHCLVLNFIYSSIPLLFPSAVERDNFMMLFLYLRRQC